VWAKDTRHSSTKHASLAGFLCLPCKEVRVSIFFEAFQRQQVETSFDLVIVESGDSVGGFSAATIEVRFLLATFEESSEEQPCKWKSIVMDTSLSFCG
jgi:hypothetical protein